MVRGTRWICLRLQKKSHHVNVASVHGGVAVIRTHFCLTMMFVLDPRHLRRRTFLDGSEEWKYDECRFQLVANLPIDPRFADVTDEVTRKAVPYVLASDDDKKTLRDAVPDYRELHQEKITFRLIMETASRDARRSANVMLSAGLNDCLSWSPCVPAADEYPRPFLGGGKLESGHDHERKLGTWGRNVLNTDCFSELLAKTEPNN